MMKYLTAILVCLSATILFAEEKKAPPKQTEIHKYYHHGHHYGHRVGWGHRGHGVGTAESSARHGHANQMRSYGQMQRDLARARYMNAKAAIKWQEAILERQETHYQKKLMRIDAILMMKEAKADLAAKKKKENEAYFARRKARNLARRQKLDQE